MVGLQQIQSATCFLFLVMTIAFSMLKHLEQVKFLMITPSTQMPKHMNCPVFAWWVLQGLTTGLAQLVQWEHTRQSLAVLLAPNVPTIALLRFSALLSQTKSTTRVIPGPTAGLAQRVQWEKTR